MKRTLFLMYGMLAYLAFFGTILYAIGFVGNLGVPKSIDGDPTLPFWTAVAIDASLLLLFAVQHSIMARPAFKSKWTKIIPVTLERSTYVLLASLCLMLMMWQWQPLGGIVWKVESPMIQNLLFFLYLTGWALVFISTFLINHFDLFGLRQVWTYYRGETYQPLRFRIPALYNIIRHPLYLGFLIAFWSASTMTAAHFLFALLTTGYILTAIRFEEKDLVTHFGEKYARYREKVPMLIPLTGKKKKVDQEEYSAV